MAKEDTDEKLEIGDICTYELKNNNFWIVLIISEYFRKNQNLYPDFNYPRFYYVIIPDQGIDVLPAKNLKKIS